MSDKAEKRYGKAAVFALGFGVLVPVYTAAVERRDALSLCLSFSCFALFAIALLRALLYPRPFTAANTEENESRVFRRVVLGSACWTLALWLAMALYLSLVRYPNLSFWDALYADLSVNLDTRHYLNIAENGYVPEVNIDSQYIIVFFPLFGWLLRYISFGGSLFITACLLNILFAALLGPVLYKLARIDFSPRASARTVRYLYIFPAGLFLVTPMTESLFLLCCLLYVYCLRSGKRWWLLPLGLLASLCRLQGVLLAALAGVEYLLRLIALFNKQKTERRLSQTGKAFLCLAGEALYSVTGLFGGLGMYLFINFYYYGDAFHFLSVQKSHWSQSLGFFFNTPAYMADALGRWLADRPGTVLGTSVPNLLVIFGVLLLLAAGGRRIRLSYLCFALVYYAVTIGATWLLSAPRYMSVLFPLPLVTAALTDDMWYDRLFNLLWLLLFGFYFAFFVIKLPIY